MRILVLDDEPEILNIISKWLSAAGHQPHTTKLSEILKDLKMRS